MGLRDAFTNAARATARLPARMPAPQPALAAARGPVQTMKASLIEPKNDRAGQVQPPPGDPRVAECRKMVSRKALLAAGAAVVPIPGLDVAADVALLMRLIGQINARFGLSEGQIEALSPSKKALVFKGIQMVGSSLIGSQISRQLILKVLSTVGVRFTTKQVTKYIPIAGQALSAVLAYSAMRVVCNRHIDDCARVAAQLALPGPKDRDDVGRRHLVL